MQTSDASDLRSLKLDGANGGGDDLPIGEVGTRGDDCINCARRVDESGDGLRMDGEEEGEPEKHSVVDLNRQIGLIMVGR